MRREVKRGIQWTQPIMRSADILVIEDDPERAAVLRQGFEQDQHAVTVAYDGGEGLRIAQEGKFGAIVLDVLMPVRDGYEVAAELRRSGNKTPILMLTARDAVTDIVRGFDCGVEDYLTKPFSFLELSARVRALIRRSQPPVDCLESGDLMMNLRSHQVTRGGQEINLTKTEFLILETLLRGGGHLVQRQELLRAVWGSNSGADSNNLDVIMSALRGKVDRDANLSLIRTVRGFGYKMSA